MVIYHMHNIKKTTINTKQSTAHLNLLHTSHQHGTSARQDNDATTHTFILAHTHTCNFTDHESPNTPTPLFCKAITQTNKHLENTLKYYTRQSTHKHHSHTCMHQTKHETPPQLLYT